jgi:threonylcarbamoyladenosine tRNA methylthiotransferase MtaB
LSSFHIINFGCRATQADGGEIEREMLAQNHRKASSVTEASVVVLNTCTVTAAADRDARQAIRRIQRENPGAKIVVTGCYAQRDPQEISRIPGVNLVVGNSHKQQLARIVNERLTSVRASSGGAVEEQEPSGSRGLSCTAEVYFDAFSRLERERFSAQPFFGATERTRPSLKIQDGCDANCSFCIIPTVRGRSRSLDPTEAIEQVSVLAASGYREIVLSGIHLGNYGRDLPVRTDLLELMRELESVAGPVRLRLSSIEPMEISEALIAHVAASPRFARHFHVPMQSGVDRLLRLMRRPYTAAHYQAVVDSIRARIPEAAIGADVIAGFPGETEEEHRATMSFIERSPLTYLHVFSFSPRPGTMAATLQEPVSPRVIKRRSAALRDLGKRKKFEFQQQMISRTLSVITLERSGKGFIEGMSENFLEVKITSPLMEPNALVDVRIDRIDDGVLVGEAC